MSGTTISPSSALELSGIDGVDAAWVLDRYRHPVSGVTHVGLLLGRAKHAELEPPARLLGRRLGEVLSSRPWPDDLVVVPVPSSSGLTGELARLAAGGLGRATSTTLGVRWGILGRLDGAARGRIRVRGRRSPRFVLLVDDTISTGETLSACAAVLRARGAERVWAAATCTVAHESQIDEFG